MGYHVATHGEERRRLVGTAEEGPAAGLPVCYRALLLINPQSLQGGNLQQ